MKSFAVLSLVLGLASAAFAAPSPVSDCRLRVNGSETIFAMDGEGFFQSISQFSHADGCAYGKIFHAEASGRVYAGGRLVADPQTGKKRGLTVAEANRAKRSTGMRCVEYSCDEIGVLRGNEPVRNEIPTPRVVIPVSTNGSGW